MVSFSDALIALKAGKKIAREGWEGKGLWVRRIDLYSDAEFRVRELEPCIGTFMPFFVILSRGHLNTWVPSISDVQAVDWFVLD